MKDRSIIASIAFPVTSCDDVSHSTVETKITVSFSIPMDDYSFRKLGGGFLQYTILRASTRLVNIMNITSYEAHSPIITQKTHVLPCRSDDGRIERKNDFHNFLLIAYPTYSINGNPLP